MKLCIADPPYPPHITDRQDAPGAAVRTVTRSRARRWYGNTANPNDAAPADYHPDAGEWDNPQRHRALLEELHAAFDGWAIATTLDGLEHYAPFPAGARVLIWHNPRRIPARSARINSTCEAVIVYPPLTRRGRPEAFQVPDLLVCASPNLGFAGAKPSRWTRWVLDALGYDPDEDELTDLFPGSGAVANEAAQRTLL